MGDERRPRVIIFVVDTASDDWASDDWWLAAAIVVVSFETTVEAILVGARSDLQVSLRVVLVLCVALKYPLGWLLGRRSAFAVLVLALAEITALLVAVSP